jgi:hypothetical protein
MEGRRKMNMKKTEAIMLTLIIILIAQTLLLPKFPEIATATSQEPHNANSMWIEPSLVNATGMSIGSKFNVTIWLNLTVECGAWQFYLIYNKNYLNATRCGYTGGTTSEFFINSGTTTIKVSPSYGSHNGTHKYVLHSESWLSGPWGIGCGSLSWIEFEIMAEPPEGGEITTILDIASAHHPPNSDTLTLNPQMEEIPLNVYNCIYTFKSPVAPPPPPPLGIARLYVDPPEIIDPTMTPCSTFAINITIENVTDLKSLEFNLTYNPDVISWVSMSAIKVQNETPTVKSITDDEYGFLWVKLLYPTAISTDTPIPVLKIGFHVDSFGLTILDLHDSEFLDTLGQPIEHETEDGFFCTLIRDVAIIDVTPSRNWAYQGWEVNITVIVKNKGIINETFELATYYDDNLIEAINVTDIAPNEERTIIFKWNTTDVTEGNYTIKAKAEILQYEINTGDNLMIDDTVWIMTQIHDVAITDLVVPDFVYQSWNVNITVTVKNTGNFTENFIVQAFFNDTLIGSVEIMDFPLRDERSIIFIWNTENVTPCNNYTIRAELSTLPYEFNITNNRLTSIVKVRYLGDVNGDNKVDIQDIFAAALSYGAYYSTPRWNSAADLNQDQKIDIRDILIIALNFDKGCYA